MPITRRIYDNKLLRISVVSVQIILIASYSFLFLLLLPTETETQVILSTYLTILIPAALVSLSIVTINQRQTLFGENFTTPA